MDGDKAAAASSSRSIKRLQPSYAFAPLLKVKGLAWTSATRVACEPTVPEHKVAHHTVAMFGALVWIRPWNVS